MSGISQVETKMEVNIKSFYEIFLVIRVWIIYIFMILHQKGD